MSEITISTSNLKKTKAAKIDGHVYNVRQPGAGDQLDVSRVSQKLTQASRDALNMRSKMSMIPEGDEKQIKLLDELSATLEKVTKYQAELEDIYVKLFDDRTENQAMSKALVRSIGVDGVNQVLDQIFNAKEVSDASSN